MMWPRLLLISALCPTLVYSKKCSDISIPVSITARQAIFSQVPITDNWVASLYSLNFTSTFGNGNYTDRVVTGYQTISGSYIISGRFCQPDSGIPEDATVQLLVHGIGFDKTYWDLPFNGYSYTNVAVGSYDFCTLAIDRFGIAGSSRADPLNVVQAPATMETIYQVTQMLRQGTIPQVPRRFSRVVHVGHSFGAFLSYFMVTKYPDASDGLILTGFSFSGRWFKQTIAGWNLHLASLNQPLRFGYVRLNSPSLWGGLLTPPDIVSYIIRSIKQMYPFFSASYDTVYQDVATTEVADLITGYNDTSIVPQNLPASYLTWSDLTANIYAFLYPPFFDPSIALYSERTKQPTTTGELFTIGNAPSSTPGYTGPVLIVTGQQDNIYCGGDCIAAAAGTGYDSVPAAGITNFPNASDFQVQIQPNTGHGMNFHYNAARYYRTVQDFLVGHGLGSV